MYICCIGVTVEVSGVGVKVQLFAARGNLIDHIGDFGQEELHFERGAGAANLGQRRVVIRFFVPDDAHALEIRLDLLHDVHLLHRRDGGGERRRGKSGTNNGG